MNRNMNVSYQTAILASFLWCVDTDTQKDTENAFMLDLSVFDGERRTIASKINEQTQENHYYSMLNIEIEQTSNTEWLEMSKVTIVSLNQAKAYHALLQKEYRQNLVRGAA